MDPLGIIGIAITALIALWQNRKASAAEQKLESFMTQLPQQLVQNVARFIETEKTGQAVSSDYMNTATYADVDGDGRDELLVQFPFGPHGYALQIYKIDNWRTKLAFEWATDAPIDFEFEDIDNDGIQEIRSVEVNHSSGYPYVYGLRDVVWYKFENGELREVKREEPTQAEIQEAEQLAEDYEAKSDHGDA